MSAAAPIPLPTCKHASVDVDALLADDHIAAAMTVPATPGTTERDLRMWIVRTYWAWRGDDRAVHEACALLHHRSPNARGLCGFAREVWDEIRDMPLAPFTDMGNAQRLALLAGTDIAHDPAAGWRIWANSSWQGDPDGTAVQRQAKRVSDLVRREADAMYHQIGTSRALVAAMPADQRSPEMKAARAADTWVDKSQGAKGIADMCKLVRDEPGVLTRSDQWDANPRLLACPDVTIELGLDGHASRKPRRADRITRVTRGRPGTGSKGMLWTQFLQKSLPNRQLRHYVQRLLGYGLLGDNSERLLVIFIGGTSTGKTTCGEIVAHVLGEYAGPFSLSLFRGKRDEGPRADLMRSLPRRMIFASEASERWVLHGDEIKRLTGNDKVDARDLYAKAGATAERRPAFMPILSTNSYPTVLGADAATWRRLIAIPWDQQIDPAKQDPHLGHKIRTQETDAVLDWLLHGYNTYCALGTSNPPTEVINATMELRASLTPLDQWLAEETEPDPASKIGTSELWAAYTVWCEHGRVPADQIGTRNAFGRKLETRGYRQIRGTGGARLRCGLQLRGLGDFAQHE